MNAPLRDFQHISDVPAKPFVNIHDYQHIATSLSAVPFRFRATLLAQYHQHYSRYQRDDNYSAAQCRVTANRYLLDIQHYSKDKIFLNHSDESLRAKAKRLARYANVSTGLALLKAHHINPPQAKNSHSLQARLQDAQWWLKQLIKTHDRQYEETAIRFGIVRKQQQAYISDASLQKVQARQQRSLQIMENLQAVSDQGDVVDMLDILKASPANPAIRRAELMNRLYGFEQYAKEQQHTAQFYTLTAPSKYHATSAKYNHNTPRHVQQHYFSPLWARIRAKLKYKGLHVYGFRIAEPHADATPHWHILLFMPQEAVVEVSNILVDYALREDPDETGAYLNRFDWEEIDPQKGSAIGYIAKYISKNVDGFGMQDEHDAAANCAMDASAQRVRAWASIWGIRQFQQIGGASITVWRELRRLDDPHSDELIETARQAADSSNWCAYLNAQGGTEILRKNQPIKPYRVFRYNTTSGEAETNQYGELLDYIEGVMTIGVAVVTRLKHWSIQEKPQDCESTCTC